MVNRSGGSGHSYLFPILVKLSVSTWRNSRSRLSINVLYQGIIFLLFQVYWIFLLWMHIGFFQMTFLHQFRLLLWWLIFCVTLIGLNNAQIGGKHSFWMCLAVCLWKKLAPESMDWVKNITFSNGGWRFPICWSPDGIKGWRGRMNSLILKLRHTSCTIFRHWHSYFLGIQTQTGAYTVGCTMSSNSQAFRFRLNYTTAYPGSPAWWQTMGLPGFHNHLSHFLHLLYIYCIDCVFQRKLRQSCFVFCCFFLHSTNVVYYIGLCFYVEPPLHSSDKSH